MTEAICYYDPSRRLWLLKQNGSTKEFTPEEWRAICMAANQQMESELYARRRLDELQIDR